MDRLRRVVVTFWIAAGFGAVGLLVLVAAISTASLQYGHCGPSALDAAIAGCRVGARLLLVAYALLSIALVLGATSLTLLWRERRQRRRHG